mgnify:CR=1 FL=1
MAEDTITELRNRVAELELYIAELELNARWSSMEQDISCKRGCMLGDGNVDYPEWFGFVRRTGLSDEDMIKYKEWLGYEEDSDDEEEDDEDDDE